MFKCSCTVPSISQKKKQRSGGPKIQPKCAKGAKSNVQIIPHKTFTVIDGLLLPVIKSKNSGPYNGGWF